MVSGADIEFIREQIKGKSRIEAIKIMSKHGLSCYEMAIVLGEV